MIKGQSSLLPDRAGKLLRDAANIEDDLQRRKAVDLAIAKVRRDFPKYFKLESTDDEADRPK